MRWGAGMIGAVEAVVLAVFAAVASVSLTANFFQGLWVRSLHRRLVEAIEDAAIEREHAAEAWRGLKLKLLRDKEEGRGE